jgi:hypothetical protein
MILILAPLLWDLPLLMAASCRKDDLAISVNTNRHYVTGCGLAAKNAIQLSIIPALDRFELAA